MSARATNYEITHFESPAEARSGLNSYNGGADAEVEDAVANDDEATRLPAEWLRPAPRSSGGVEGREGALRANIEGRAEESGGGGACWAIAVVLPVLGASGGIKRIYVAAVRA